MAVYTIYFLPQLVFVSVCETISRCTYFSSVKYTWWTTRVSTVHDVAELQTSRVCDYTETKTSLSFYLLWLNTCFQQLTASKKSGIIKGFFQKGKNIASDLSGNIYKTTSTKIPIWTLWAFLKLREWERKWRKIFCHHFFSEHLISLREWKRKRMRKREPEGAEDEAWNRHERVCCCQSKGSTFSTAKRWMDYLWAERQCERSVMPR